MASKHAAARIRDLGPIRDAQEGIDSWRSSPDLYCACEGEGRECYLHGVTIPKALKVAEAVVEELRDENRV